MIHRVSVPRPSRLKKNCHQTRSVACLHGCDIKFWHHLICFWTLFDYCYLRLYFLLNSWNGGILPVPPPVLWQPHRSVLLFLLQQCFCHTLRAYHSIKRVMGYVQSVIMASIMRQHYPQAMFFAIGVHMIRLRSMANALSLYFLLGCGS